MELIVCVTNRYFSTYRLTIYYGHFVCKKNVRAKSKNMKNPKKKRVDSYQR